MTTLLKDMIEVNAANGPVINGVDNPNITSVDSTTPIVTGADELKEEEAGSPQVKVEEKKVETEAEKKPEGKEKEEVKEKEEEKKEEQHLEEGEDNSSDAVQKRINKAVKKQRTAERERDWEKSKRLEVEQELAKLKGQVPAADKPKRSDFADDEDYLEALTDWKVEQKLKSGKETTEKTTVEQTEKEAVNELYETIDDVIEKGRTKYQDFDSVALAKEVIITKDMTEAILDSSVPSDILYYLGKNSDIAEEISKLSPLRAAKRIAKIEDELSKPPDKKEEKKEEKEVKKDKKEITQTPPPITPVRATGMGDRDPSQMSPKEYRAWRESNKG